MATRRSPGHHHPALVPPALLGPVARWASANYQSSFIPNTTGPGRFFAPLRHRQDVPPEVAEIKRLAMEAFGIPPDAEPQPTLGDFCGVNEPGAFVHPHQDDDPRVVRLNVMISKPPGGEPVLAGEVIPAVAGDAWRCPAGQCVHSSLPVIGPGLRIVLSFGFLLQMPPWRVVGPIPTELLFDAKDEAHWHENPLRSTMRNLRETQSILLRHSPEYDERTVRDMPLMPAYAENYSRLVDYLKKYLVVKDVWACFLARLPAGCNVEAHADGGRYLHNIHRLHIPVRTDPACVYVVENRPVHMEVGKIYQIDNTRVHSAHNYGKRDRVHIVVNVYSG